MIIRVSACESIIAVFGGHDSTGDARVACPWLGIAAEP
jgi:hypothetical protein